MGSITFEQFPANWQLPLVWIEVDPSKAGLPTIKLPALLVGVKLAAGTAEVDVPVVFSTYEQAIVLFGAGSQLALMARTFFNNNNAHEVWALPVAEASAGSKASGTVTFGGTATANGGIYLYIAGARVVVPVSVDDDGAAIAASAAAVVNAATNLPVVATVTSGAAVLTLTAKWKGADGNDIDVRVNYLGTYGGEATPAGVTVAFSGSGKLTTGTGAPDYATGIGNIGDEDYEYVAVAQTDTATLNAWKTEYGFSDSGRWGWMRQTYGHVFGCRRGTYSDLLTWGATNNAGVVSVQSVEVDAPAPVWALAAAYTARAARSLMNDPAQPLQTLELLDCPVAPRHKRFNKTELNNLANTGMAVMAVNANGNYAIMREATTYQKNAYGQGDDAYALVTTLATLAKLFRNMTQMVTSTFPRHKLADNGTRFGPGQKIVTPNIMKAAIVAQYRIDEFNGLVENAAEFKKNLIVERDGDNPNRLSVLYPPDLVNGLRILSVLAQFRLQYNRGIDTTV